MFWAEIMPLPAGVNARSAADTLPPREQTIVMTASSQPQRERVYLEQWLFRQPRLRAIW